MKILGILPVVCQLFPHCMYLYCVYKCMLYYFNISVVRKVIVVELLTYYYTANRVIALGDQSE